MFAISSRHQKTNPPRRYEFAGVSRFLLTLRHVASAPPPALVSAASLAISTAAHVSGALVDSCFSDPALKHNKLQKFASAIINVGLTAALLPFAGGGEGEAAVLKRCGCERKQGCASEQARKRFCGCAPSGLLLQEQARKRFCGCAPSELLLHERAGKSSVLRAF